MTKQEKHFKGLQDMNKMLFKAGLGDKYQVFGVIGRGGFAIAYKAQDLQANEVCVIKKMDLQKFRVYDQ